VPGRSNLRRSAAPEEQNQWLKVNAERAPNLPVINEKSDGLPGAEERKTKLGLIRGWIGTTWTGIGLRIASRLRASRSSPAGAR
jgi:hypothetical protein